ncbi:phospholipid scramblase-related protein [Nanoarchaeota archaeon]
MANFLENKQIFVKEIVRFLRLSNVYELFDQNQKKIGEVREKTNLIKKILRIYKLDFYDQGGNLLFTANKPFAFIKQKFFLYDAGGQLIGNYYKKIIAIMPQFFIYNNQGEQIGHMKGDFFAWNFHIEDNKKSSAALINKVFSGALREFLTTADSYHISIQNDKAIDKRLLIAAPFIVDMLMKEDKNKNRSFGGIH